MRSGGGRPPLGPRPLPSAPGLPAAASPAPLCSAQGCGAAALPAEGIPGASRCTQRPFPFSSLCGGGRAARRLPVPAFRSRSAPRYRGYAAAPGPTRKFLSAPRGGGSPPAPPGRLRGRRASPPGCQGERAPRPCRALRCVCVGGGGLAGLPPVRPAVIFSWPGSALCWRGETRSTELFL